MALKFEDLKIGDKVRYGPFTAAVELIDPTDPQPYLLLDNGAELIPGAVQFDYMEKEA